ncbi:MAG: DUF4352 domain-containing protein [Candidatus Pristimantibacillus lignocellulolyticus]|uniref:DUF4352 domain-containing protein n=1 Tax=Candidatus Pristimantibacillus lignocellulolyticus TaxID=2994561 RepID=A0A9J6ZAH3_9BACL|nr:MAG: DUF4352 domain-containing protein [Candidatus Pristimantibacillus lignocellulolyticus]
MPTIMTSAEPIMLSYLSFQLTFSMIELQRDQHSVVIKTNVKNTGKYEGSISSNNFMLVSDGKEVLPNVSYISEEHKHGMIWAWKRLKPEELCTVILKFNIDPNLSEYNFKYNYRKITQLIKRFQMHGDNE